VPPHATAAKLRRTPRKTVDLPTPQLRNKPF
jgi:hypothetical protein